MNFARLFPPANNEAKEETCQLCSKPLDQLQFSTIEQKEIPSAVFIDGGSAILFATPARAFGIIKLAMVRTEKIERKEITTHQYLVSITQNGSSFTVKCQAMGNADERVESCLDCEFTNLPPETTPAMLLDPLRTLAEHAIAPSDTIVIHDGSLRTTNPILQNKCTTGKNAIALAKTSGMLTSRNRPLGVALLQRAPIGTWSCQLNEQIYCVRLHSSASHVFLLEGNVTPEALSLLHAWSTDMSFPGYPYPMVLADQLARVTNNERDAWKLILSSDKQCNEVLSSELKATDAHAMLEHILYGK